MKKLIKENKQVFWILGLAIQTVFYYVAKFFESDPTVIHIPLDDKIPFIPVFILFYISWFLYIPISMLFVCFKDKKYFLRQCLIVFSGILISNMVFLIYPTVVDIRPTADGGGLFNFICRVVFYFDNPPLNALPSLHVSEAVMVHLTTFTFGPFRKKALPRIASAILMVLICLSTMFVKQHSALDVIYGLALAVILCIVWEILFKVLGEKYGKNI